MTCSIKDTILSMDRQVPRYTSYPTAPNFITIGDDEQSPYAGWLRDIDATQNLSLYVHVPFCSKMCWYCGCHTKITNRYEPVEAYVNLMMQEIEILSKSLGKKHKIGHLHFGGGTPGILLPEDFERIIKHLKHNFDFSKNAEIAIEIDPRSLDRNKAESYAKCGVNRVSLGVQDLNEKVLKAVNRAQSFEINLDAVNLFKLHGINNISIDLLYGLPHQTIESMEQTIDKAMLLKPDRVSLFGYAHVPWMKKHMRLIDETALPDKEERFDLFATGESKLIEHSYEPIGIDHFAKPDDSLAIAAKERRLHRNFQGYTTDESNILIGIGISSIGKFPNGYAQNAVDMPIYEKAILDGALPIHKYCHLTLEDKLRADIIERLMCDFEANIPDICNKHGFDKNHLSHIFGKLEDFESKKLVSLEGKRTIKILPHARIVARLICAEFDNYYFLAQEKPRHAKAI